MSRICLLCRENETTGSDKTCQLCQENACDTLEQNAELIAAAPDYDEEMREVLDFLIGLPLAIRPVKQIARIRRLIAKAEARG